MWSGALIGVTTLIIMYSRPTPPKPRRSLPPPDIKAPFDCYLLTTGIRNHQSLPISCQKVMAKPFTTQQWLNVDPAARHTINSGSQTGFFDLTNNNTVNIFHNHVEIWKQISFTNRPALILEDDVKFHTGALQEILKSVDTVSGIESSVLKLHNLNEYQFRHLQFGQTQCVCENLIIPASTLAYYITPQAASILATHFIPIKTHVDLYVWRMACVERKIYLFSTRNIAVQVEGISLHRPFKSTLDAITWKIFNSVSTLRENMLYLQSNFHNKSHCPPPQTDTNVSLN